MPPANGLPDGTPAGIVADAPPDNWVDRYAPPATRPWLRLSRADRPIGTWLLLIPCFWGLALAIAADPAGARLFDLWVLIGCTLGSAVMRGAGCTWNDITDREYDAAVARTRSRPIPSGQVSVKGALLWLVAQSAIGGAVLLTFPPAAILWGLIALLPVAVYPFAKRFTWWPQAFLGIAFNWGAPVAWTAHAASLGLPAILLWLGGLFWTLFYDTIYAHQDKEDDALIGVKSTARLFGDHGTRRWLAVFAGLTVLTLAAAVLVALPTGGARQLALSGVAVFGLHMLWQLARLDTRDPALCLRLFRTNRDAGLAFALFLAGAAVL